MSRSLSLKPAIVRTVRPITLPERNSILHTSRKVLHAVVDNNVDVARSARHHRRYGGFASELKSFSRMGASTVGDLHVRRAFWWTTTNKWQACVPWHFWGVRVFIYYVVMESLTLMLLAVLTFSVPLFAASPTCRFNEHDRGSFYLIIWESNAVEQKLKRKVLLKSYYIGL